MRTESTGYPEFDDVWDDLESTFPNSIIRLEVGPWRAWDVKVGMSGDAYNVDFYSVTRHFPRRFHDAVDSAKASIAACEISKGRVPEKDFPRITNMEILHIGGKEEIADLKEKLNTHFGERALGYEGFACGFITVPTQPDILYLVAPTDRADRVREALKKFLKG